LRHTFNFSTENFSTKGPQFTTFLSNIAYLYNDIFYDITNSIAKKLFYYAKSIYKMDISKLNHNTLRATIKMILKLIYLTLKSEIHFNATYSNRNQKNVIKSL